MALLHIESTTHAVLAGAPGEACLADWLRLMRAEYIEMPGLHLTRKQAQRLWNLDPLTCGALLNALVGVGFLRRTDADAFVRAD